MPRRLLLALFFAVAGPGSAQSTAPLTVRRFATNPIIRPEMLPDDPVVNINGPSLIRVPAWLSHPLGKYYLYFANHRGPEIHLAYADHLEGPWTIVRPGPVSVLEVGRINHEVPNEKKHAASPDIYLDEAHHEVRMYFHFSLPNLGHTSTYALSPDGLHFTIAPGTIGRPYLRSFTYQGWFYLINRDGKLMRSKDGLSGFEIGPPHIYDATRDPVTGADLRHTGLRLHGDRLDIFYTRVGDAPESIRLCTMKLVGDWKTWTPGPSRLVLAPETAYEGADLPVAPSEMGDAKGRLHAVRDPDIYEEDGHVYLAYAVAGESGIALAELSGLDP